MVVLLAITAKGSRTLANTFDDPESATSAVSVQILPGEDITSPEIVNPIDPEGPSLPIDPINPNPGALRINHVSDLNFGDFTITGQKAIIASKKVKTTNNQDIPAFVSISDLRGNGAGWSLKILQNGEFVRGGVLKFQPEYNGADQGIQTVGGELTGKGDEIDLLIAEENAGMGSHSALLGGLDGVTLKIPKDAIVGKNTVSFIWNLVADPSTIIPEEMITIPDDNLRTAIKEALDLTDDTQITESKMKTLTAFQAQNKRIRNLEGIEYASNLTEMNLLGNQITAEGIVPAFKLQKLKTVNIDRNSILDSQILYDWAYNSPYSPETVSALNQSRTLDTSKPEESALLEFSRKDSQTIQLRNLIRNPSGSYSEIHTVANLVSGAPLSFEFIDSSMFQVKADLYVHQMRYHATFISSKLKYSSMIQVIL